MCMMAALAVFVLLQTLGKAQLRDQEALTLVNSLFDALTGDKHGADAQTVPVRHLVAALALVCGTTPEDHARVAFEVFDANHGERMGCCCCCCCCW